GAVIADHREDLVAAEVEIGVVERHHPAIALVETPALEHDIAGIACRQAHIGQFAHAEIFLIHWSMVTATMIRTPTAKSCHSSSSPERARPLRNTPTIKAPMTVPTIEPRPPNSEVPPITTAVIESRLEVWPACGLTPPMRPMKAHAATAQIRPARL